ncbi:MAG: hypothetical protein HGA38_01770 [Candidatus Moranbacteria bacterium]|nr:hypothetical protein [Candidatus Moranbacteria bacterium]
MSLLNVLPIGRAMAANWTTLKGSKEIRFSRDPVGHVGVPISKEALHGKRAFYLGKIPDQLRGEQEPTNFWSPAVIVLADGREYPGYAVYKGYRIMKERIDGEEAFVGAFRYVLHVDGITEQEAAEGDAKVLVHDVNVSESFRLDASRVEIDVKRYREDSDYRFQMVRLNGSSLREAIQVVGEMQRMMPWNVYRVGNGPDSIRIATPMTEEQVIGIAKINPKISFSELFLEKTHLNVGVSVTGGSPGFPPAQLLLGLFRTLTTKEKGGFSGAAMVTRDSAGLMRLYDTKQVEAAWGEFFNANLNKR